MTLIPTICHNLNALRAYRQGASSAEIGALASVFKKSATELKPKPKQNYLDTKALYISSSSSCRVASTDIPDPISSLLPIVHRLWQVSRATSFILSEDSAICEGPYEYIAYELVPASLAVSCVSGSSNLDSFRDGM